MFLLFLGTLGLYGGLWLHRQAPAFNRRLPDHPITRRFTGTVLALLAADLGLFLVSFAFPEGTFRGIEGVLSGFAFAFLFIGCFRVRRRILHLAARTGAEEPRVRLVWTWLFTVAYLQSRINHYRDALESAEESADVAPFTDSSRWSWWGTLALPVAGASLLALVVLGSWVIYGVGSMALHLETKRAAPKLGGMPPERLLPTRPEPHPVLALTGDLGLSDEEAGLMGEDWSRPRSLDEDQRRRLRRIMADRGDWRDRVEEAISESPPGLGVRYELSEDWEAPWSTQGVRALGRLLYLEGILALDQSRPAEAAGSVRRLGSLAGAFEPEPDALPLHVGSEVERIQLHLVEEILRRCPTPPVVEAMPGSLLTRSMEERYVESLSYRFALYSRYEETMGKKVRAEAEADEAPELLMRGLSVRTSLGVNRFMVAGDRDWTLAQAETYGQTYSDMYDALHFDPDEMNLLEKLWRMSANGWTFPARLRAVADSRDGAYFALEHFESALVEDCAPLEQRLGPLSASWGVGEDAAGRCVLLYRPEEELDALMDEPFPLPPFRWPLTCG